MYNIALLSTKLKLHLINFFYKPEIEKVLNMLATYFINIYSVCFLYGEVFNEIQGR
jgi:hypothetical protein